MNVLARPRARPRWVIAVRVSSEAQEVAQQEQALRAAALRLEADVVEVVRIEGVSAWDPKTAREVERRMLEPIAAGRADVLAVWALDRVTRQNIKQTLAFIERLEKHLGGQLFSLQEPIISTATMVPETRELFVSLFAFLANRESSKKSERVKAKRDAKINRAAALGQMATWGEGHLATPTQVCWVWLLKADKLSLRGIGDKLGLSKSQVHRILSREKPGDEELAMARAEGVPVGPAGRASGDTVAEPPLEGGPSGQSDESAGAGGDLADSAGAVAGVQGQKSGKSAGDLEVAADWKVPS